jgi:hypothetical protein
VGGHVGFEVEVQQQSLPGTQLFFGVSLSVTGAALGLQQALASATQSPLLKVGIVAKG